ncbi:hypothetical protein AAFX91_12660 [Bradyrhizobium sp. 31Argb]|uniref:hypothetical protein n=1 Tax=Bradyrhizobium sp. 31Argb TaxID=3141247 RepID=UPI00374A6A78
MTLPTMPTAHWFSASVFAAATIALQVGTGGLATGEYYRAKGEKGYAFARYDAPDQNTAPERTPSQEISRVREVLKLSITDLAGLFGVSRQAIYDWQSGKAAAVENASKLSSLARAADSIAAEVPNPVLALRRKLAGGKTFVELIKEGGDAEVAALNLISMLRSENEQRARVEKRLAGRVERKLGNHTLGVPMLDEES